MSWHEYNIYSKTYTEGSDPFYPCQPLRYGFPYIGWDLKKECQYWQESFL